MENALLNSSGTSVGSMVGISVGGTNSGWDVGSTVAIAVGLGMGVTVGVAVIFVVVEETADGVALTVCPHAVNSKLMKMKIITRKTFFILTHSLGRILDVCVAACFIL